MGKFSFLTINVNREKSQVKPTDQGQGNQTENTIKIMDIQDRALAMFKKSKHCQQNLITVTTTGITMINFKFNIGSDSLTPKEK